MLGRFFTILRVTQRVLQVAIGIVSTLIVVVTKLGEQQQPAAAAA